MEEDTSSLSFPIKAPLRKHAILFWALQKAVTMKCSDYEWKLTKPFQINLYAWGLQWLHCTASLTHFMLRLHFLLLLFLFFFLKVCLKHSISTLLFCFVNCQWVNNCFAADVCFHVAWKKNPVRNIFKWNILKLKFHKALCSIDKCSNLFHIAASTSGNWSYFRFVFSIKGWYKIMLKKKNTHTQTEDLNQY